MTIPHVTPSNLPGWSAGYGSRNEQVSSREHQRRIRFDFKEPRNEAGGQTRK
jgi:hypothetical protein